MARGGSKTSDRSHRREDSEVIRKEIERDKITILKSSHPESFYFCKTKMSNKIFTR
jgi:hypothetical protein